MRQTIFILLILCLWIAACHTPISESNVPLETYQVAEGFQLDLVAAEPMIQAPVDLKFDDQGRIWVLEMPGYMPNINGTDEEVPNGRILILEDQNGNGKMDKTTIFLDSLVLPRAIALVYGGLLYSEPPNLWFVEIKDGDQPGKRTLVDSLYAVGGNVEHQTNALLPNVDNWIYNAKGRSRYQLKNGVWKKQETAFRGQWGLTHDDFGRLYYNDNTNQLKGDYMLPNFASLNSGYFPVHALNRQITDNQRVYPLQPTAVNRGYIEGILDGQGKLREFTSACSPEIYRAQQFPEAYWGNAFVCAPEANLIKRNILTEKQARVYARQAWEGKEFIVSLDEGFRPVSLHTGPDGAMYIVDMHRGIIQHRTYMTPYLRDLIESKQLDTIQHAGRILKVYNTQKELEPIPDLSQATVAELVEFLHHTNGFIRDRAQWRLVHLQSEASVPLLQKLVRLETANWTARMHALWALAGMDALQLDDLEAALETSEEERLHATVAALLPHMQETAETSQLEEQLFSLHEQLTDNHLAPTLGRKIQNPKNLALLSALSQRYPQDSLTNEAIVSGLEEQEDFYLENTPIAPNPILEEILQKSSAKHLEPKQERVTNPQGRLNPLTHGLKLYMLHCSGCHGEGGEGIANLAPPLYDSEYVKGPSDRLILLVLHGLRGPVTVKGQTYNLNAVMPGLINNPNVTDKDITNILNYIRNGFGNCAQDIRPDRVAKLRDAPPQNSDMYTEAELTKYLKTIQ